MKTDIKKQKILLSIGQMDSAFLAMKNRLSEVAEVTVCNLEDYSLQGVDIFIGKKLHKEKLLHADRLKAVFAYKTGVDDFPLDELQKRNILLVNSHADSRYIAEYAFALALTLVCRIAEYDRNMRTGDWTAENPCWKSLFSMKVGLLGFGGIGKAVNEILVSNGIATYTLDRGKQYKNITAVKDLPTLIKTCDLFILSLPATHQTDKMFNAEVLAMMKGKFVVNVGRSNCFDEKALFCALQSGALAGAAIDTWRQKPASPDQKLLPFDEPFHKLPNVVMSSHKAMQVVDGHRRYVEDTLQSVLDYMDGKLPANVVDLKRGY